MYLISRGKGIYSDIVLLIAYEKCRNQMTFLIFLLILIILGFKIHTRAGTRAGIH